MIIQLLCRYPRELNKKELELVEEELQVKSVINDNFDKEEERIKAIENLGFSKYEYGPFVLNLKDISNFNSVDEQHTCVRLYGGIAYVFKIGFEDFKELYQVCTGNYIQIYDSNSIVKVNAK